MASFTVVRYIFDKQRQLVRELRLLFRLLGTERLSGKKDFGLGIRLDYREGIIPGTVWSSLIKIKPLGGTWLLPLKIRFGRNIPKGLTGGSGEGF